MILGLSTSTYTLLHVLISLVGIASGLVVMYGFFTSNRFDRWTLLFLVSTALTSISGFAFPFTHLLPSHKLGILSLIVLTVAAVARYARDMNGIWRPTYVVGACIALYFNLFVLVVQSFEKVPTLKALAPTQTEAPFLAVQGGLLALFIVLTVLAVKQFYPTLVFSLDEITHKPEKRVA